MTPVDQEFFYQEEPRQYGDCVRAVLASLLDLPIKDVPHFLQEANGAAYEFYTAIDEFLALRGLEMQWNTIPIYYIDPKGPDVYHYISGPSPRSANIHHAVVGLNGQIVHDPHPSRAGLLGDPKDWKYSFLTKLNDL